MLSHEQSKNGGKKTNSSDYNDTFQFLLAIVMEFRPLFMHDSRTQNRQNIPIVTLLCICVCCTPTRFHYYLQGQSWVLEVANVSLVPPLGLIT